MNELIINVNEAIDNKKSTARKIKVELMKFIKSEIKDKDSLDFIESVISEIADRKAVEKLTNAMNNIEAQISSIS